MKSPIVKILENPKEFAELTYHANEFKHNLIMPNHAHGEHFSISAISLQKDCSFEKLLANSLIWYLDNDYSMEDIENLNNTPFETWLDDVKKYWISNIIDYDFLSYTQFSLVDNTYFLEKFKTKYDYLKKKLDNNFEYILKECFFNLKDVKIYHLGQFKEWCCISNLYLGYNKSSMFIYDDCFIMD